MADLDQIKGINSRQIKLLQEHGISSAEALAMSPSGVVADIRGLGDKTAQKLIWNARNALGMTDFVKAVDIDENVEYFTTGSSELDRILGGGFQTGKLTEVFGAFKSGKTNLAHTIAVTVQLPKERGGLSGAVAYVDTENTFSKEKIKRIAKRFQLDSNDVLSKIFQARIYSSDHQIQMIQKAESLCKTRNVKLIVIDSLMALMRAEYVGIGKLAARQGVLNSMIHALSRIAETYNCAVLLTNQVATVMKGMFSANDAIGGNIVAHGCHFRVQFKTKGFSANSSLKRKAIIVDAADLPPEEAEFFITPLGIADTEEIELPDGDAPVLDFEVETLYEEESTETDREDIEESETQDEFDLTDVKGIGEGTAKNLKDAGIKNIKDLLDANPDELSKKVSGASKNSIRDFQKSAKQLV
ncbi:MAG: DNA repair and recombination protein RadA [Candidatus Lokiarchaeota archaeon]|nr:DNA repair and recombination protein RadA [Candidatus Lokiarchaeota archaeon]MBD3338041.1 DNA repair and recombination protein RadA [Candidatus Lokiarchaeota archaeon]